MGRGEDKKERKKEEKKKEKLCMLSLPFRYRKILNSYISVTASPIKQADK